MPSRSWHIHWHLSSHCSLAHLNRDQGTTLMGTSWIGSREPVLSNVSGKIQHKVDENRDGAVQSAEGFQGWVYVKQHRAAAGLRYSINELCQAAIMQPKLADTLVQAQPHPQSPNCYCPISAMSPPQPLPPHPHPLPPQPHPIQHQQSSTHPSSP